MTVLSIDFETRATVDLRATGVYPYAQHKDTDIWCFAWAFDDEEPEIWHPGIPGYSMPIRFMDHIIEDGELRAWNAAFERIIWKHILTPRYGFPLPKDEQWVCSAAEAAAMSLPRSLDQCAQVTGVGQQKDSAGYELMMRMTRPRSLREDGTPVWWDVEDRKQRLYEYCKQDVRTERAITKVLRRLTISEREMYKLTERMNDRGLQLDVELVKAAKEVADEGIQRANAALTQITEGAVTKVTSIGPMKNWLNANIPPVVTITRVQGHSTEGAYDAVDVAPAVDSVSKAAVRELLESDLDPKVRQVLELRADAGRSSIAKLDAFLDCACEDGRIRGMLMYHGASTGRWTGRLAQLHNLMRGEVDNIESYIPDVLARRYDAIDLLAHPVVVVASMLRSTLTASPGHELLAADYSAIEARVLVVLAGQTDVVEMWRNKQDVYKHAAARLYGVPLAEVTPKQRQTGKFQILGSGFGMGAKKAVTAGKAVYGLDLTPEDAKAIIDGYRSTHSEVVNFWYESERAAMEAVENAGSVVTFGALRNLKFTKQGAYLYLILPSKRPLVYAAPKIVDRMTPWGEMKPAVEISAVDSLTKKWSHQGMYGGLWVENIVQAVSRDIMAEGKLRAEAAGYPPLLSVHDEPICERKVGEGSLEEYQALLSATPEWAAGWPISTEGWRGFRYRK